MTKPTPKQHDRCCRCNEPFMATKAMCGDCVSAVHSEHDQLRAIIDPHRTDPLPGLVREVVGQRDELAHERDQLRERVKQLEERELAWSERMKNEVRAIEERLAALGKDKPT